MPSLLPIGGSIRLNASAGGAATVVPLADGGFAAVYRVANGPDVFTLYDDNFQPLTGEVAVTVRRLPGATGGGAERRTVRRRVAGQ